jgi:hypothetical protein
MFLGRFSLRVSSFITLTWNVTLQICGQTHMHTYVFVYVCVALHREAAIDTWTEELTGSIQDALAACVPKRRPSGDLRPSLLRSIQSVLYLKKGLKWLAVLWKLRSTPPEFRCFPSSWKRGRFVSMLKVGKDPILPSSYQRSSLLDTAQSAGCCVTCNVVTDPNAAELLTY